MQFAIFDEVNAVEGQTPTQVYNAHLDQMVLAEKLGFHSYWIAEHHFSDHRMAPHPNLILAASARETSRLLIGNMVNVLPFHNPVRVAEETAMLDQLTGGRLQVGIGRGVQPPEFRRLRVNMAESREMFLEAAAMLRQLWTTRGATSTGRYWSYEDVTIMPPVLQQPHPPLWFTGLSEESAQWASEQGLPFATTFLSPDETAAVGEEYRRRFRPSAMNPRPHFTVMRHVYVSDSRESARREVGHVYDQLFHRFLDVALTSASNVPDSYKSYPVRHARLGAMNLDQLIEEGLVLFGSPDDVAQGVADLQRRGADMLMLWPSPQNVEPKYVTKCLELFAREVLPRFATAAYNSSPA